KGKEGRERKGKGSRVRAAQRRSSPPPERRHRLLPLHQATAVAGEGGRPWEGGERQPRNSAAARTPPALRRHIVEPTPPFCFFSAKPNAIAFIRYPNFDRMTTSTTTTLEWTSTTSTTTVNKMVLSQVRSRTTTTSMWSTKTRCSAFARVGLRAWSSTASACYVGCFTLYDLVLMDLYRHVPL
ncbi:unnamed protein product, partial [Urochloa humidicola]